MGCTRLNASLQELTHLTNSFSQLKQAQTKFKACIENVAQVKPENKSDFLL
jgi:prefoldin alpha subunit